MKNRLIVVIILMVVGGGLYLFFGKSTNISPTNNSVVEAPSKECSGNPTPQQTEGPYYRVASPERINISQGVTGEPLTITGFVFDKDCKPISNAWLDFWQADAKGAYDNSGYRLRGHLYSDHLGKYMLETIMPGAYETRPPHIHVKVRAGNGPILTSQLYFPNAEQNQKDLILNQNLIVEVSEGDEGKIGKFNFILQ